MGFGGKIQNYIGFLDQLVDNFSVRDVTFHKLIVFILHKIFQIFKVAAIGELVQIYNFVIRVLA